MQPPYLKPRRASAAAVTGVPFYPPCFLETSPIRKPRRHPPLVAAVREPRKIRPSEFSSNSPGYSHSRTPPPTPALSLTNTWVAWFAWLVVQVVHCFFLFPSGVLDVARKHTQRVNSPLRIATTRPRARIGTKPEPKNIADRSKNYFKRFLCLFSPAVANAEHSEIISIVRISETRRGRRRRRRHRQ